MQRLYGLHDFMDKFKGKYRIPSTRLQNWDYRWNGYYFVTICTENKEEYFGEIKDGKMHLSPIGIIADVLWHEIKNHAKNVELDEFIVMPNHIHGILILDNDGIDNSVGHTAVETGHALSLLYDDDNNNQKQSGNNDSKISEKIHCHQLLVHTNPR